MRVKLAALMLLALPVITPVAALADDMDQVIPPAIAGRLIDPHAQEPIDFSRVEISTLTPADRFVNATTPLVVSLALGSLALVVYTLVQGAREIEGQ